MRLRWLIVLLTAIGIRSSFPGHFELFAQQKHSYTLRELLALGKEHNPDLAVGVQQVAALEAAYQASKRFFNPELELHYGRAESHDGLERRTTRGIALTQPLENPFKRRHRIRAMENAWEAERHTQTYRGLTVSFDIKSEFFFILMLEKNEDLFRQTVESIQKTQELIEIRARLGEVKPLEAIKLQVETLKARQKMNALQAEREIAQETLNNLLGNMLPPHYSLQGALEYTPRTWDEEGLVARALDIHPLILADEQRVEQAASRILYTKWQRFPDLALRGFSVNELDGVNQGVGITFDIPLWNFRSKELAEAQSLSQKAEAELRALRLDIGKEIRSRIRQIRLAQETLDIFSTGLLRQAEESLRLSEISYREGEISLLEFLDSQRTYNTILQDYHQALYAWNIAAAALEKALGESL